MGNRDSIPLREEVELARNYLDVEQVRFGDRLRVEADIEPACENCAVPPLLLQPLVENAVKHGVGGMVEGGAIRLSARREEGRVTIIVENAFDADTPPRRDLGMGLMMVRKRLQARYGADASLEAGASGGVYRVVLRTPCEAPGAPNN